MEAVGIVNVKLDTISNSLAPLASDVKYLEVSKSITNIEILTTNLSNKYIFHTGAPKIIERLDFFINDFMTKTPHQNIVNNTSKWKLGECPFESVTYDLSNIFFGSKYDFKKYPKTAVMIVFFNYLLLKVGECGAFLDKCYKLKEIFTKGLYFLQFSYN